jgi:hypothetical protein
VREVGQLPEDEPRSFVRVITRKRADAGRRSGAPRWR